MEKFKKIIMLLLLGAVCSLGARAEFRWGPAVGIDISNLKFKQDLISTGKIVGPQVCRAK